ncbi:FcoT family thioesterase [Amycolatopsis sp. NPDC005003]
MITGEHPAGQLARYDTDRELLERVLRVYREHCRYLKTAELTARPDPPAEVAVSGAFAIPESCYIDDTGHFNAVEFNICYNQMAYYLIAKAVKDGLHPVFAGWTLDDFWRLQLGNILITDFKSTFKRQMRGKLFEGRVAVTDVVRLEKTERWDPLVVIRTKCGFWDETGGNCRGEVKIAISNPV